MNKYLTEIEHALKPLAGKKKDKDYKAFREKTTELPVHGIRVPALRALLKEGFSFSDKSDAELLKVWDFVWKHAKSHEAMLLPLYYYGDRAKDLTLKEWRTLKTWMNRIENWEHADNLSYIYSMLYERFPKEVYPQFLTWNKSSNPWKRRISVVSTIYYASKNRTAPPLLRVFPLIKNLIHDKDPYVQKGIGWQLREAYKLKPGTTYAFLKHHIKDLAAITFSYATEKVTKEEKAELKRLRKG